VPGRGLVITGRIATLGGDRGPGWVEAIAIDRGRVVRAGSIDEASAAVGTGAARLRLAPDEVAIPGLTDAHLHLAEAALAKARVQLEGATSIDELLDRVRSVADGRPAAGSWIEGAGWDPDSLGRWPTADDLERAAPGRLVALWAHDHHALLTSPAALAAAGIEDGTPNPVGGVIRRDDDGHATGILHETAARLVTALIPPAAASEIAAALIPLAEELLSLGVVAVHDPGGLSERADLGGSIAAYRSLAAAGSLAVRVHACVRPEQLGAAAGAGLRSGEPMGPDPRDRLRLGWLKTFADGSLGSRTAALLAPLERGPGEPVPPNDGHGVWMTPPEELRRQVDRAADAGITTQIHGLGDAAVRVALDVLAGTAGQTALMPRVEHVQLVDPADIGRFAQAGIAASMQPVHLRSDAAKARRLWGDRADSWTFAMGSLDRAGAVIAFGTDAPVEPVDPWPGLECAVTRAAPGWPAGMPPLGPNQALPLWRAIRAACLDPALTAAEGDRGRLVRGHRADVVIIPAAAMAEPVEVGGPLWNARPRLVLVDGEIVAGR
jgi:predicted amidohydrolase YtcJ